MQNIPLTDIDATAFPRDRSSMDDTAMAELFTSIARDGLRNPIEVTPIEGDTPYALLSGHRRLATFLKLAELNDKWRDIPAFIRHPADIPTALRMISEENAIRADISPWDQSRYAVDAFQRGHFETIDAAITGLYPSVSKQKRSRLRAVADVVEHFEGTLTDPHTLKQYQLTRLAAAIRGDFTDLMHSALEQTSDKSAPAQWQTLSAILSEAEAENAGHLPRDTRPGRPIRYRKLRPRLNVRREYRPDGWTLVFTGQDAQGHLIDTILDDLERNLSPDP